MEYKIKGPMQLKDRTFLTVKETQNQRIIMKTMNHCMKKVPFRFKTLQGTKYIGGRKNHN